MATANVEGPLTFGEYIKMLRLSNHLNLTQAAKRLDMTVQRLCDIESGRRYRNSQTVPLDFVSRVARTYKVSVADIIRATEVAVNTEKTVNELVNELAPTTRMSELLAEQVARLSKTYGPDIESLAVELEKHVKNTRALVSTLSRKYGRKE